jgi:hypothetical protein
MLDGIFSIQEKMLFFNLAQSHSQVTNIFSENNLNSVNNSSITFSYNLNWLQNFASLLGIWTNTYIAACSGGCRLDSAMLPHQQRHRSSQA